MSAPSSTGDVVVPVYAARAAAEGASSVSLAETLALAIASHGARLDDAGALVTGSGAPLDARAAYFLLSDSGVLDQLGVGEAMTGEVLVDALGRVRERRQREHADPQSAPVEGPSTAITVEQRPENFTSAWPPRGEQDVTVQRRSGRWWRG